MFAVAGELLDGLGDDAGLFADLLVLFAIDDVALCGLGKVFVYEFGFHSILHVFNGRHVVGAAFQVLFKGGGDGSCDMLCICLASLLTGKHGAINSTLHAIFIERGDGAVALANFC